jgi:tetratricopeptide (TPR) repeat protein
MKKSTLLLNNVYLKLKNYDKSISFLSGRIKLRPNDVSLYGVLGSTYYINGNNEKAVETWDKGILVNKNSKINYTIISNSAIENRAFEIAIKYLEEGKTKSSNPTQFSYQLAQIYSHIMEYKKAALEYVEALTKQPSQLDYIKRRMDTYLSAVGATEECLAAIDKESENVSVNELLSFLYVRNNEYNKAFEVEKKLAKSKNDDGVRIYNFATQTYSSGKYDVASQSFNYLIENYPSSRFIPNSKLGFARTLESKLDKEWKTTHNNWKPISEIDTTEAYKYNPIIETYKSILDVVNGELANEALYRIGRIYLNRFNDFEMAEKYFQKIIEASSLSIHYGKANLEIAKILVLSNKLDLAKRNLQNVFSSSQTENGTKEEAKYLIAQIEFYKSNFAGALSTLANINKNLSNDLSNDAIQLAMIINVGKRDSLNLVRFANAELFATQSSFVQAEKDFKELSENKNLFFINNISRLKYSEILIAQSKYPVAIEVLKELSETKEMNIFADRSFYMLAQVYEFGIADEKTAISTYEKFLELFPNSLYLEKSQKNLKRLKNKRSENI